MCIGVNGRTHVGLRGVGHDDSRGIDTDERKERPHARMTEINLNRGWPLMEDREGAEHGCMGLCITFVCTLIGQSPTSGIIRGWGEMQHTGLKGLQLPSAAVAVTEIDIGE